MRQLRLRKADLTCAFMYRGEESEEKVESVRQYLKEKAEILKRYSFEEAPLCFESKNSLYRAGYVSCRKETVVRLPEKGSVYVAGCEGGFIVAAEYENWQAG